MAAVAGAPPETVVRDAAHILRTAGSVALDPDEGDPLLKLAAIAEYALVPRAEDLPTESVEGLRSWVMAYIASCEETVSTDPNAGLPVEALEAVPQVAALLTKALNDLAAGPGAYERRARQYPKLRRFRIKQPRRFRHQHRPALKRPAMARRGRAARVKTNGRVRGSRRSTSSAGGSSGSTSDSSDDDPPPAPTRSVWREFREYLVQKHVGDGRFDARASRLIDLATNIIEGGEPR